MLTILPKIVTDGLVLYLDAANPRSYPGSGDTWFDLTRYRNNGTLTNGPTFTTDVGGSMSLNSTLVAPDFCPNPQCIVCPNSDSLAITGDITLTAWIKLANFGVVNNQRADIIAKNTNQYFPTPYFLNVNGGGVGTITLGGYSNYYGIISPPTLTLNSWIYFVGTAENVGINRDVYLKLYLNGSLIASSTRVNNQIVSDNNPNNPLIIGASNLGGIGHPVSGSIAVAQIYNRALTGQEVLQNYDALKYRFGL